MLRTAHAQDKEELKALWDQCFDEEPDFLRWFFEERFVPSYCSVYERDGKIIGCAHSIQLNLKVREHILPCAVICGVSTHPDYRRQGVGRAVMQYLMHILRGYGVVLTPHRPVKIDTYFSIGHYPVSDSMYIEEDCSHPFSAVEGVEEVNLSDNYDLLYSCYLSFIQRYSGIIQRSYPDFVFKCRDYLSCGAKCIIHRNNKSVDAYCIYFDYPDSILGEELAANNEKAYRAIYNGMRAASAGKKYTLRTAADAPLPDNGAQTSVMPRGVVGAVNVPLLLSSLGLSGCSLEILDSAVPENCGVYDLSGKTTDKAPQLRIEAGRLAQWALGYRSIDDVVASGEAELLGNEILPVMKALSPCPCFIFDEY